MPKSASDQHNSSSASGLVDGFSSQGMPIPTIEFLQQLRWPIPSKFFTKFCGRAPLAIKLVAFGKPAFSEAVLVT
jgi:hypothetical protein